MTEKRNVKTAQYRFGQNILYVERQFAKEGTVCEVLKHYIADLKQENKTHPARREQ